MRAMVLGARGAVGSVIVGELERRGHDVTPAGRREGEGGRVDVSARDGIDVLTGLAVGHDVLINASGVEDERLATLPVPVVEISATSRYLAALRRSTGPRETVVLGAGLAPGLSTTLVADMASAPDDEIDVGVMLGTGEHHGTAAVAWTIGLIGQDIFASPDGMPVTNFRQSRVLPGYGGERPRRHLRADFPDHVLLGTTARPAAVRSHLAMTDALSTRALALAARRPRLRALVGRAPHVGSDRWRITVVNRRRGEVRIATGRAQSAATGVAAVLAAERAVELSDGGCRGLGAVTMADLTTSVAVADRLCESGRPTRLVGQPGTRSAGSDR
ncbi:NAD(P)-dependent oxidoreductase [Gordonia sp. VNK1]|uniref:NAD(P)-dependent oxidoreductase n=1 Tax=Gordonia oleivorans TaxID=3156618 RepID=UPI0032B5CCC8